MSQPISVTACRVFLNQADDEHLKGFASIILNDSFAVCDLKIIQGAKGLFVAMPSRRRRDGTFHDVAHPINHSLREHIEQIVLREFEQVNRMQAAGIAQNHGDHDGEGCPAPELATAPDSAATH